MSTVVTTTRHQPQMSAPAASLMDNYGPQPVTFVRGRGARLWDEQGRCYLDFLCGLAVTSLGHSHPQVAAAVAAQAEKLTHVSNLFANAHTAEVVARLDRLLRCVPPDVGAASGPGKVLFQNSGAEAVEAALKLARKHHGRGRHFVVSAYGSFHGRTLAALAATGQPAKHEPFHPMPEGFRLVAYDDVAALEAALGPEVGAVLLEAIQGEGGVVSASEEYLRSVRRLCDERGILLVLDEIQTGLGRTGDWFAFQHARIQPDIVTIAKALGNGVPVGAVWARPEVAAAFSPGDHGSTFAGQPLALAAAAAVLATMEEIDAPAEARARGAVLRRLLASLQGVAAVRGRGLLVAAEVTPDALAGRTAAQIASECLSRGLIVNGVTSTALRLAPPLIVSDDELHEGVSILEAVLSERPAPTGDGHGASGAGSALDAAISPGLTRTGQS